MEKLQKLKLLLGLENDDKDELLLFVIDKVSDMVCNYCNIKQVPKGLENVMLNIGVDFYISESLCQEKWDGRVYIV